MAYTEDVNVNLNVLTGTMGGITAIMGGMSALTSSFGAMGTAAADSFGTLDGLLVSATALITTFAVQSAQAFGEYEQGMKIVQTVSGQAGYAMNELSNKANEMSIAYRTSINDITDGLQTLGRAGLNSVSEQLEVLESGLQTAKLEGRNLNGVLEELIQNTAMLGGDLKSVDFGEQTEYLNTIMVGTSMTAPITSHDISQTLQYAGGTAAAAGANLENKDKLEDLMGTIAAFAQKGVSGSMAGTALRAFFTKPASQDASVTDALSKIGLSPEDLWEDGGESMKKVSDQVGIINNRMKALNMSTMDQVELWGDIVGPKMGQQMMKLDSSSIKDLTRDIQDASSAEDLATQTLQTYTQKLSEMSEQGSLAYREFGEKVSQYLTPVVDIITKVLGLLSDPHINFVAFAMISSVVAHGFRKAWGMITTVATQIKEMLSQTAMAIQNINSLASGSAGGFAESASQVDFLNAKLHETDATLQAIQAKSMGIRSGYIMPGDHGLQMVPRGTLKAYEEDVIIDKNGVMGGNKGQIYPGQYKEQFVKSMKEEIIALEEQHEQKKLTIEKEIAAIQQKQINAQEVADATHAEKMASINTAMRNWKTSGLDPIAQQQMLKDSEYLRLLRNYGSVSAIPKESLEQVRGYYLNDTRMRGLDPTKWEQEQKSLADTSKREWLNPLKRGYTQQISNLKEEVGTSEKSLGIKKEQLKELENKGITRVQTRMDMMTTSQFRKWMKGLDENDPLQAYSKYRTQEMIKKSPDLYREYARQGYMPAFVSKGIPDSHPNRSILEQAHNTGATQEWIRADKERIAQQKALWAGETTYTKRAQNLATQRMNAWGDAMNKGTRAIANIPSRINNFTKQMALNSRDPGAYLKQNASLINRQAGALNLDKLSMSGMSAAQALDVVAKELGISRTELSMLMADESKLAEVSRLSGQELAQLTNAARLLREKIIESTVADNMDTEAVERHSMVMTEDIAAVSQHQIAMKTSATTMGGFRGTLQSVGSSLRNGASTLVGFMGGPLMAAMMGFTFITQQIAEQQQHWQEKMQEASNQLSEANDQMTQASEKLKEIYGAEYSNLSDADMERITDTQYAAIADAYDRKGNKATFSDMYNNEVVKVEDLSWTKEEREQNKVKTAEDLAALNENAETLALTEEANIQALENNSAELRSAAHKYAQAIQKVANAGNDGIWGFAGVASDISDAKGSALTLGRGGIIPEIKDWLRQSSNGFLDEMSPVLTESQADKNYAFGTDFASVFLANSYRFDVEDGLHRFFGNDYDQIISIMGGIDNKMSVQTAKYGEVTGPAQLLSQYSSYFNSLPSSETSTALALMKDNPDAVSVLAKSMFRQEQQYNFKPGVTAAQNYNAIKAGYHPSGKTIKARPNAKMGTMLGSKNLPKILDKFSKKKLTVQDKDLKTNVQKFREMTGNRLSEQTILMMGGLQMLNDMNKVSQEIVAPGIIQTVQTASAIQDGTLTAAGYAGSAASGAGSAAANAYAIAVFLHAQAVQTAWDTAYHNYKSDPDANKQLFGFDTTWLRKYGIDIGEVYDQDNFEASASQLGSDMYNKYGKDALETAAITTYLTKNPGATVGQAEDYGKRSLAKVEAEQKANADKGTNFRDMMNTVTRGLTDAYQEQVMSAYDQSKIGERGSGDDSGGSGGGGDGGGGGGGSDSGSGSTTNRVDLVLCNKKTIPKLNVNLFKKPPQFTINNKQFSIRDINVNTQDKPDAMVDAVKNSIIKTQQQMDPKIIQDERAVYDPAAATDGTTTPKGKTPVATK